LPCFGEREGEISEREEGKPEVAEQRKDEAHSWVISEEL